MFEEIPPERHGLARVRARRFVLGPFVVGGGLVLALLGGSMAVAATVITASTIGLSSPPTRPAPGPSVRPSSTVSSSHATASRLAPLPGASAPGATSGASVGASGSSGATAAVRAPRAPGSSNGSLRAVAPTRSAGSPATSASATASGRDAASPGPEKSPAATPNAAESTGASSSPVGNALVYVSGYDASTRRIEFRYATVLAGAGTGGSDLYSVQSASTYSAAISPQVTVTSGGVICPPSGSACTADELIHAAATGFFADVALDSYGTLLSVIERDNVAFGGASLPPPSSAAAAASPTATETASP